MTQPNPNGVVQYKASILPEGKLTQNIEVDCSHCGVALYPVVIHLLIRLIEQPAEQKLTLTPLDRLFVKTFNQ